MLGDSAKIEISGRSIRVYTQPPAEKGISELRFFVESPGLVSRIEFTIRDYDNFPSWVAFHREVATKISADGGRVAYLHKDFEDAFRKVNLIALIWDAERCFDSLDGKNIDAELALDIAHAKVMMVALRYKRSSNPEIQYYGRKLMKFNEGRSTATSKRMREVLSERGDLPELC